MINLSYRFDQNSSSLELAGMPDVSKGDSENTIGIISYWKLKIIGSPLLEGKKDHLEFLMKVVLQYTRSYISGIRKTFTSPKNIVTISPCGINHKLLLNSTKKEVKSLEIILDDAELSDLTRCLDLLRFDSRFNIEWDICSDIPFRKKYIASNLTNTKTYNNLFISFIIFLCSSALLLLIPINNKFELRDNNNPSQTNTDLRKKN
tara:strand:+ start:174 stop:788 length:615 start_codon:yes stop_codon:yes gene_type:complete